MRARLTVIAAVVVIGLAAGCSSVTDPAMACTGNPKCKADQQPALPSTLQPLQVSSAHP